MRLLHFADLHLGVENYGHIDPATGLSSRFLDFLSSLDQVIDYAQQNQVDLVLFSGDAYKSREPTQTQQREFARRVNRLASSGIPVFLLTGNHDLPNAIGRATATEIFDTLAIKNVYVASRPGIILIPTGSGPIQVATLPWLRRSALLTREDSKNLDFAGINTKMQQVLTDIISSHASKLDPRLPAILAAHVWVTGAQVGSERLISIGQEHVLLLSNVANPAFDYIALGHIHRHQVLSTNPPVVYAGSLERVDFSEEADDKGFYQIDIESNPKTEKRQVTFDFHPLNTRRFITIDVNVEASDLDPTATILHKIAEQGAKTREAIVRVNISLPAEVAGHLRDNDIKNALKETYYFTIAKDIKRQARFRLGQWSTQKITPVEALKAYLESKKTSPERTRVLLEYGEKLIQEQETRQ